MASSNPTLPSAMKSAKQVKISSNSGTTWDSNSWKLSEPEEKKEWFSAVVYLSVVFGTEILLELNEDVGTQVAALPESKITSKGDKVGSVTVTAATFEFGTLVWGEEKARANKEKQISQLLPACLQSHLGFLHKI